jgi:hypothetical protein
LAEGDWIKFCLWGRGGGEEKGEKYVRWLMRSNIIRKGKKQKIE